MRLKKSLSKKNDRLKIVDYFFYSKGKSKIATIELINIKLIKAKIFFNNFILLSFKRSLFKGSYIIVNTILSN